MIRLDDYKRACKIAARIVEKLGDAYLPVFERAHEELNKAKAKLDLKTIAIQMAHSD